MTAVCLVPTVVLLGAVGWSAVPSAVSQGCLIAAGVLLWRGPTRREGLSLLAAAALLGLSAMGTDTLAELGGYWLELGWLAFWAAVPPIAYVVLAHPQGRLGLRRHRWLLAAIGLWAVGLQGLRASTWDPAFRGYTGPAQWTSWWPSEVADQRLLWVQTGVCVVVSVWAIVECVVRWRGAEGLVRVPVGWCSGAGIALGVGVLVRQMAFGAATADLISRTMIDILGWVHLLLLAIAVAVLVGIGVREAVRRGEVGEAVLRAAGDPAAVEQFLRVRLLDPQLHVAFTINGQRVGADGRALAADDLPAAGQDRHVLRSDADGSPLVTVNLARHASADPALVRAALEAAAAALDNGRLNLEREIHLAEISASRARIVESGVTQRRQLERDLHDGAQQHLLAVSANLARAERLADGDRVVGAIDDRERSPFGSRSTSCACWRGECIRPPSASMVSTKPWTVSPRRLRTSTCGSRTTCPAMCGSTPQSRRRSTSWSPRW